MKRAGAKRQLKDLHVRPSRGRGQNFLVDDSVIDAIIEFGRPQPGEQLVEIGPGLGALTGRLLEIDPGLIVIEIEAAFCSELARACPGLKIVNQDFREVDLGSLGDNLAVFGNIPYSISTDTIFHLIAHSKSVRRAVLMLQEEFAERVAAGPGGRDYGVLSISCQLQAAVRLGPRIESESFYPRPKVDSRLIELAFGAGPRVDVGDSEWFAKVVRAAFCQRRRKLANSLKASGIFQAQVIPAALEAAQIDGDRRAETLSIEEFVRLAAALMAA